MKNSFPLNGIHFTLSYHSGLSALLKLSHYSSSSVMDLCPIVTFFFFFWGGVLASVLSSAEGVPSLRSSTLFRRPRMCAQRWTRHLFQVCSIWWDRLQHWSPVTFIFFPLFLQLLTLGQPCHSPAYKSFQMSRLKRKVIWKGGGGEQTAPTGQRFRQVTQHLRRQRVNQTQGIKET